MFTRTVMSIGIIFVLVAGCATPPKTYEFDPVIVIDSDFDSVWSAVVEYFAIGSLPIDIIEKDSGIIVSSWMNASGSNIGKEDKTYCDCGGSGLGIIHWSRGKFNVFVKPVADGGTELRVTCNYQQRRELMDVYKTVNCASTGYLEHQLHEYVSAKVQGVTPPGLPSFTPGEQE